MHAQITPFLGGPSSPLSTYVDIDIAHVIKQVFSQWFYILQVIKNQTVGRPGNKAVPGFVNFATNLLTLSLHPGRCGEPGIFSHVTM